MYVLLLIIIDDINFLFVLIGCGQAQYPSRTNISGEYTYFISMATQQTLQLTHCWINAGLVSQALTQH